MGKDQLERVQGLVDKVFALFMPLLQCNWLSWGRELLFAELQEQVE